MQEPVFIKHTLRTARQEQTKEKRLKKTPQELQNSPRRLSVGKKNRHSELHNTQTHKCKEHGTAAEHVKGR